MRFNVRFLFRESCKMLNKGTIEHFLLNVFIFQNAHLESVNFQSVWIRKMLSVWVLKMSKTTHCQSNFSTEIPYA